MRYRVLTVAREFGSGGAAIARLVAEKLGWRLLDNALILEIANRASVDPEMARKLDEQVDSWVHRVSRRALWYGAPSAVASVTGDEVFDAQTVAKLARELVLRAYEEGNCVIVGRGAQCTLQSKSDVFHAFVYGPWAQRVSRIRMRGSASDREAGDRISSTDSVRENYVKTHFGCAWKDPHLYDLMISSAHGEEWAANTIVEAMRIGESE